MAGFDMIGPLPDRAAEVFPLVKSAVEAGVEAVAHPMEFEDQRVDAAVRLPAHHVRRSPRVPRLGPGPSPKTQVLFERGHDLGRDVLANLAVVCHWFSPSRRKTVAVAPRTKRK